MISATLFPDTTILIQYRALDLVDWDRLLGVDTVKVMLTPTVIHEIEEIENQIISKELALRARQTLKSLNRIHSESHREESSISLHMLDAPHINFAAEGLNPDSVPDQLIAHIIAYQHVHALEYIVLLSDDLETREKALSSGVDVITLPDEYLRNTRLAARHASPLEQRTPRGSSSEVFPIAEHLAKESPLFSFRMQRHSGSPRKLKSSASQSPSRVFQGAQEPTPVNRELIAGAIGRASALRDQDESKRQRKTYSEANVSPRFQEFIEETAPTDKQAASNLKQSRNEVAETTPVFSLAPPPPRPAPAQSPREEAPDRPANKAPASDPSPSSFSFVSQQTPAEPPADTPLVPTEPESEPEEERQDLRLSVGLDETRTTITIHHPIYPSLDEVNEHLESVQERHPKLPASFDSGSDSAGDGMANASAQYSTRATDALHQRKTQRIKKYNASLDAYYTGIEKYMSDLAEFENFKRRSAELNLTLFNDLPEDLKSLYISIHFPGNVRVYSEENLPEKPVSPPPPEEPDLDMLFDPIRLPYVPMPNELSFAPDLKMRGRNPAPMEVRWNKGWDVIYSIREIEKNSELPFNPLYIAFNSFDHATSFRITYRITVASASYEQLGDLEIVVRKEI